MQNGHKTNMRKWPKGVGSHADEWTLILRRLRLFSASHSLEWKFRRSVLTPRNLPTWFSKTRCGKQRMVLSIDITAAAQVSPIEMELIRDENGGKKRANFIMTVRNSAVFPRAIWSEIFISIASVFFSS